MAEKVILHTIESELREQMAAIQYELRKISKRLNQDSINKFIKERNGLKA